MAGNIRTGCAGATVSQAEPEMVNALDGILVKRMLINGFNSLCNNVNYLNEMNIFPVSDSDTGTNMKNTVEKGVLAMGDGAAFHTVLSMFANAMMTGSRGNSGLILSQYFRGISDHCRGKDVVTAEELYAALQHAYQHAYKSVLHPVEGTMLSVMRESVQQVPPVSIDNCSVTEFFATLVEKMLISTQQTVMQMPLLCENNVVDSGALGLYLIFDGMNRTLQGMPGYFDCEKSDVLPKRALGVEKNVSFFRYCTEFVVSLRDANVLESVNRELAAKGDSIVVAKDNGLLKIHIHTNQPKKIMDEFAWHGEIASRKIDDLFVTKEFARLHKRKHDEYAIVVFTEGEGNAALFERMGADVAFSVPYGHVPDEDELKVLLEPFLLDFILVFPLDKVMQDRLNRIRWFSDVKNMHVAETAGLARTFFSLTAVNFIDSYSDVVRVVEAMKKREIYQACISRIPGSESVKFDGRVGTENVVSSRSLNEVLGVIATGKVLGPYSSVVVIKGLCGNSEELEAIQQYMSGVSNVECSYFEGGQQTCDYVLGAY